MNKKTPDKNPIKRGRFRKEPPPFLCAIIRMQNMTKVIYEIYLFSLLKLRRNLYNEFVR